MSSVVTGTQAATSPVIVPTARTVEDLAAFASVTTEDINVGGRTVTVTADVLREDQGH